MTYAIKWDPKAEKQLEKLPKDIVASILAKVKQASDNARFIEPLTEHEYGCKIRVGDYRVLVDVSHNPEELYVRYVGHRKNVYKRTL